LSRSTSSLQCLSTLLKLHLVLCSAAAAPGPITVNVCAPNLVGDCCGVFNATIQVKFCRGTAVGSNDYYVYRLKSVPVCDMAYCAVGRVNTTSGMHFLSVLVTRNTIILCLEGTQPDYDELSIDQPINSTIFNV